VKDARQSPSKQYNQYNKALLGAVQKGFRHAQSTTNKTETLREESCTLGCAHAMHMLLSVGTNKDQTIKPFGCCTCIIMKASLMASATAQSGVQSTSVNIHAPA
jgi:hypothetical protein